MILLISKRVKENKNCTTLMKLKHSHKLTLENVSLILKKSRKKKKHLNQGFPNSFTKSPPFQKFEKKSPPIISYSNFSLEGAFFSKKFCVRNVNLD